MTDIENYLDSVKLANTVFSDELNEELSNSQFYAQPKNTELKISFGDEKPMLIGNAVVMNIEYTDEKIPIYSYNSDLFKKFLKGKSVITGVIALRKTTVDKIISLIKTKNTNEAKEKKREDLNKELETVKELMKESENDDSSLTFYSFYKNKEAEIKKSIENLDDINNTSYNKYYERIESTIKGDLLYYNSFTQKNNGVITISYKDEFIENIDTITDILFTRKQTEINVGRNDIIEIYHFIGNPNKEIGG